MAMLLFSVMLSTNVLTAWGILTQYGIIDYPSDTQYYIIEGSLIALLCGRFFFKKRYRRIITKYEDENSVQRKVGVWALTVYIVATFTCFFIEALHRQGQSPYGNAGGYGYEEAPRPENGEDRNSKISLTLRQAVKGATVSLSVDGKKFKAHVPAGVKDGQKIKLAGKGKPGINGGKAGDLYLHVTVKPDATFSMRGHDIVMDLPVTVGQAVAGGKVEAKDIDGNPVTFKVPAGSSSGAEVKLAGLGVQRSNQPGDLIGRVQIMVPAKPGLAVKHAAKEFDEKAGDYLSL